MLRPPRRASEWPLYAKITPEVKSLGISSQTFRERSTGLWMSLLKVVVPSALNGVFINLAQWNTKRNVETCGILAGRNVSC
jgi:hypothetical protein